MITHQPSHSFIMSSRHLQFESNCLRILSAVVHKKIRIVLKNAVELVFALDEAMLRQEGDASLMKADPISCSRAFGAR